MAKKSLKSAFVAAATAKPKAQLGLEGFVAPAPPPAVVPDQVQQQIFNWLANLKLLHNVPFRYLVPDERMLPPESIRFFHLDLNWVNALVDGAYSIGRYTTKEEANTFDNRSEGVLASTLGDGSNKAARDRRTVLLKGAPAGSGETFEVVTGFLLRSEVVKGWKGLQVNAYRQDNNPDSPDWDGTSLQVLRLERLSDDVLFGMFEGETYRLDIHEPSEGLHFGMDADDQDHLSKILRNPSDGSEPYGNPISHEDLLNNKIIRNPDTSGGPNQGGQVLNLYRLSALMFERLGAQQVGYTQPPASVTINNGASTQQVSGLPATGINSLVSSDFALQMVEGVGMVTYINDNNPG